MGNALVPWCPALPGIKGLCSNLEIINVRPRSMDMRISSPELLFLYDLIDLMSALSEGQIQCQPYRWEGISGQDLEEAVPW